MGRIDDSLLEIQKITDSTERALQVAGLLSTLFKVRGIVLIVVGQLAFDTYANAASDKPEIELAAFSGKLAPRLVLEIMRGQVRAKGSNRRWTVAGLPIRLLDEPEIFHRELCRDIMTEHGVVKLLPAEEITARCILAAVYPEPDNESHTRARLLLINGLTNAFKMDWPALHEICHRPDYRIGEELAKMRLSAKKDVDAIGASTDPVHETFIPEPAPAAEAPKPKRKSYDDDLSSLY